MINIDAELIVVRDRLGARAKWTGGRYARMSTQVFRYYQAFPAKPGRQFRVGGLKLQLIEREFSLTGADDSWVIARVEDPIAWVNMIYRGAVFALLKGLMRCESAILAFRGRYKEGERAYFTGWIADRLL
jgi:hypothetical protein